MRDGIEPLLKHERSGISFTEVNVSIGIVSN